MAEKQNRRGLGRGLSALMADVEPATQSAESEGQGTRRADRLIPIEKIFPNPDQPRRSFTPEQLSELADSIKAKGVIQPIIVRERGSEPGTYEIVAGERRWRASQMAELHEMPVLVREFSDIEVLEVAIIENIQRADLNAIEEAAGYKQLMFKFGHTQERLAEALGKSRSHIANLLRLLNLPEDPGRRFGALLSRPLARQHHSACAIRRRAGFEVVDGIPEDRIGPRRQVDDAQPEFSRVEGTTAGQNSQCRGELGILLFDKQSPGRQ